MKTRCKRLFTSTSAVVLIALLSFSLAQESTITFSIEPANARIVITGEGVETELSADGETDGESIVTLEPGEYEVSIHATGFASSQRVVVLGGGENLTFTVRLAKQNETSSAPGVDFSKSVLWIVLSFLVVFIFLYFLYLSVMQRRYYRSLDDSVGSAEEIVPAQTPAVAGSAEIAMQVTDSQPLNIEGPASFVVARPSRPFKPVALDRANWPRVEWFIDQSDRALLHRMSDGRVRIIASESGVYVLRDSCTIDGVTYEGEVSVIALERAPGKILTIPWVGAGYGSILISVIVVGVLLILDLTEVLEGDETAPILGALIGYKFGKSAGGGGEA